MLASNRLPVVNIIMCIFAVLFLYPRGLQGISHAYIEDFSTKQHCDTLLTTADWDTIAGELKLPPFRYAQGGRDTPGTAHSVAVSGDRAYVADFTSLQIMSIFNPLYPGAGAGYGPLTAIYVAVSGDYAYVAALGAGLQIIDVNNLWSLSYVGGYDTPGSAQAVAVSGCYAYVADDMGGLQVVDISDPSSPSSAGYYATPSSALAVAVSGDYAYVTVYQGLQVVDISDPTAPAYAGSCSIPVAANDVAVSGDYAYVASSGAGLQVVDISDPAAPVVAGSCDTYNALAVAVWGDHAYVADSIEGLKVIDIGDPTAPTLVESIDTPGGARGVAVSGDYAYVADWDFGLRVIDISDPAPPSYAGSCPTAYPARGVTISGDYAYVAGSTSNSGSSMMAVDISDPTAPSSVGQAPTVCTSGCGAYSVAVSGDYAYMAASLDGFYVMDISDPAAPVVQRSIGSGYNTSSVTVSGNIAYVAEQAGGLAVIDISDPSSPSYAGRASTPGSAYDVAVSGDHAYVADYDHGLRVFDISNPTSPTSVGSCSTDGVATAVAVSGHDVYLADGYGGLKVINVQYPASPLIVGSCSTPDIALDVDVSGDYAFVAAGYYGLQVMDVRDSSSPAIIGSYDTPGTAQGVTVSGDYAYVADGAGGLQVIRVFQREIDADGNKGRSLVIDDGYSAAIVRARLEVAQTDSIAWELSADDGSNWQGIANDGSWNPIAVPGTDLLWRSTHTMVTPDVNPGATGLEIDWLYQVAPIDSIVDVPDDQGRSVRISFTRSGYDFLDETSLPVVGYAIYRRLDDPLLVRQVTDRPAVPADELIDHPQLASFNPGTVRRLSDRTFIVGGDESASSTLPPGVWEGVGWVLPTQADSYTARVNTLVDSTASGPGWTVFVTAVHTSTPSIWFVSYPDSGYSTDNLPPSVPEGLVVAYNTGSGNTLDWEDSPEEDFQYYRVYRGDSEEFTPGPGTLVHETMVSGWSDPEYDGWDVHYKVTALDRVGNESGPASPATVTGDEAPSVPKAFALHQNVPNPFNPATTIRFDLPRAAYVKLCVYNVKGELVGTLIDREMTAGRKEIAWTGESDQGSPVASGVYFYRLAAGDFVQTRKMVLLR